MNNIETICVILVIISNIINAYRSFKNNLRGIGFIFTILAAALIILLFKANI